MLQMPVSHNRSAGLASHRSFSVFRLTASDTPTNTSFYYRNHHRSSIFFSGGAYTPSRTNFVEQKHQPTIRSVGVFPPLPPSVGRCGSRRRRTAPPLLVVKLHFTTSSATSGLCSVRDREGEYQTMLREFPELTRASISCFGATMAQPSLQALSGCSLSLKNIAEKIDAPYSKYRSIITTDKMIVHEFRR